MRSLKLSFTALALAMVALLTACGGKASDKLIGKWTIDVDKMGEMEDIKKLPDDQKKAAMEMAKGMASSMTFEFTKEKILLDAMGQKKEGPYKVKSEAGDKVVIEGTMDGKTETMNVEFKGDGMIMGDGKQTFPLKRK
jgi:hypothetical protein